MKISLQLEGDTPLALAQARVEDRLRWSFGSYSAEVRSATVELHPREDGILCKIRVRLRSREEVEVSATCGNVDEALDFVAARASSAVARRLGNRRLLGS